MADPRDFAAAFDLPPEEAIKYLEKKKLRPSWSWDEVKGAAAQRSFSVAKLMQLDLLATVHRALQDAQKRGVTLAEFRKNLEPTLKSAGWWGKAEQVNPNTGATEKVQLGSPWRLALIYRMNAQSSLMAGRFKQQQETAKTRPYLQFLAVNDTRTTDIDRKLDGTVFRADDPDAGKFYPPLHFGCRARVRTLSEKQLEREGLKVTKLAAIDAKPAPGFAASPADSYEPNLEQYPKELATAYEKAIAGAPVADATKKLSAAEKLAKAAEDAGLTDQQLKQLKAEAKKGILSAKDKLGKLQKAAKGVNEPAPKTAQLIPAKPATAAIPAPVPPAAQQSAPANSATVPLAKPAPDPPSGMLAADAATAQKGHEKYALYVEQYKNGTYKRAFPKHLNIEQEASLKTYTSEFYSGFNERIRTGRATPADDAMRRIIDDALKAAPKYRRKGKPLVRDVSFVDNDQLKQFVERHAVGSRITYPTVTSTSTDGTFAPRSSVKILIETSNGVYIDKLSDSQGENEVLLYSDMEFVVTKVESVNGRTVISMKEAKKKR